MHSIPTRADASGLAALANEARRIWLELDELQDALYTTALHCDDHAATELLDHAARIAPVAALHAMTGTITAALDTITTRNTKESA
jgi:hypothetical protein